MVALEWAWVFGWIWVNFAGDLSEFGWTRFLVQVIDTLSGNTFLLEINLR